MDMRIPLSDMDYGPEEERAALEVIHRRWLTMGAVTQKFEQEFAEFIGVKHAFAVSSCTAALHIACLALDIGEGDEVIAPALTFVATTNAILYTKADVHFADIQGEIDLTISPKEIEKSISPHTKAIMVMHYGGYPCPMTEIMDIARKHDLAVIEDAAHAPGAFYNECALGTWGDAGCFSFFSNKNLATGEGGMFVTERDDIAEKVRILRSHGMTSLTWERHQGHAYTYDVVDLGHNYRIDEIRAALGLVQLQKLVENNSRRKTITERYRQGLEKVRSLGGEIPFLGKAGQPAYHIFPFLLPEAVDRRLFMERMRERGIQTSVHYPPIHKFSYYQQRYPDIYLPRTESCASREVTLPLYPGMSDEDVEFVISSAQEVLEDCLLEKQAVNTT